MSTSLHVPEQPPGRTPSRRRWKGVAGVLMRYGVVYCIFGVCGVLFLLCRAIGLLVRGPGDSGI